MDGQLPFYRRWDPKLLFTGRPDPSSLPQDFTSNKKSSVPKDVLRGTAAAQSDEVTKLFDFSLLFQEIKEYSKKGRSSEIQQDHEHDPENICPVCFGLIDNTNTMDSAPCPYPDEALKDSRYSAGQHNCPICLGWLASANSTKSAAAASSHNQTAPSRTKR